MKHYVRNMSAILNNICRWALICLMRFLILASTVVISKNGERWWMAVFVSTSVGLNSSLAQTGRRQGISECVNGNGNRAKRKTDFIKDIWCVRYQFLTSFYSNLRLLFSSHLYIYLCYVYLFMCEPSLHKSK